MNEQQSERGGPQVEDAPESERPAAPPGQGSGDGRGSMSPDEVAEAIGKIIEQRENGDLPPGPDEEPVSREDIQLRRKHGRPEPIKVRTPIQGLVVEIVPLSWGVGRELRLDHRGLRDLSGEEMVQIVREHVVTPDLSGIDVEWAEKHMDWASVTDLAAAVMERSRSTYRMEIPSVEEVGGEEEGKD